MMAVCNPGSAPMVGAVRKWWVVFGCYLVLAAPGTALGRSLAMSATGVSPAPKLSRSRPQHGQSLLTCEPIAGSCSRYPRPGSS